MISVLVADDHGVVREGLRSLLEGELDILVSGEAGDGVETLEQLQKQEPDVVILDITMPRLGGLQTLERIRAEHPRVKTILLSMHAEAALIQSAVSLGADGYLLKTARSSELVDAIRAVLAGDSYFSPPVARTIIEALREPGRLADDPFSLLSKREREVLGMIADGLSAKEIATRLGISAKTVEAHRTSLMRKLGVKKATELVRYAVRRGLIDP